MTARSILASGVVATALIAGGAPAEGSPLPDPPGGQVARAASAAALVHTLVLEYRDAHRPGTHNELVLILNDPRSAFV